MGQVATTGSQSSQTSNSQFLWVGSTMYLVTNSDTSGVASILSSTDYGTNFTSLTTITGLGRDFDPALCLDTNNVIHILGTLYSEVTSGTSLIEYRYDTTSSTLTGPFTLTTGSMVGSDYDIAAYANGDSLVCASLLNADNYPGESVVAMVVNSAGTVTSTVVLEHSSFRSGNTYGQVALVTIDHTNFELYIGAHPKQISFRDWPVVVTLRNLVAGTWDADATTLYTLAARYVSEKLSIVADGQKRYLAFGVYSQDRTGLIGNILLGYKASNATAFAWKTIPGTAPASYSEPTLCISPEGAALAWIQRDFTNPQATTGSIAVADLNVSTWALTPRADFRHQVQATYLRGTMQKLPAQVYYAIVAETQPSGDTEFYGGWDTPPVPHVVPKTLNMRRNTLYQLSGATTSSATLDPLTFTWTRNDTHLVLTPNGPTCGLFIPYSAGPSSRTITVTMSVVAQMFSPVTDTCVVTVDAVPAPVIAVPDVIMAARNISVTITPVITNAGGYPLSYAWTQKSGTPFDLSLLDAETLTFITSGASINGEDIVFTLTINDGINDAVAQDFTVQIAAYAYHAFDPKYLHRSLRPGNVMHRNTTDTYPPLSDSVLSTILATQRSFQMRDGTSRRLYLSKYSVMVYGLFNDPDGTQHIVHRQILPEDSNDIVNDAIQTETDETWILTYGGLLCRYVPSHQQVTQDLPANSIPISSLTSYDGFYGLQSSYSYAGKRVLALYGPNGCLLVQVNSSTGAVTSSLMMNTETGYVYGGDAVTWVRFNGVESTNQGQVFLGSSDADGNTFETLINLNTRRVIGTWDASKLKNITVVTGEFLFGNPDTYSGRPQAPVLGDPLKRLTGITIFWSQERADLVTSYTLYMSTDNVNFAFNQNIGSGEITTANVPNLVPGKTYYFYIIARSLDGNSLPSNTTSISL